MQGGRGIVVVPQPVAVPEVLEPAEQPAPVQQEPAQSEVTGHGH